MTYDAAGNVTSDEGGLGYGYDFENRLVEVFGDIDADGVYDPPGEAMLRVSAALLN